MPARTWDAATYHRISSPMEAMGLAVLERLPLRGDETVLDAGCGTGRVTAALCDRLPRGRVIAVDASPDMVAAARVTLGPRADVREVDLLELELDEPVDAILSTATFHWIEDHDTLFRRLHAALRPGGLLVAQCGGRGNLANLLSVTTAVTQDDDLAPAFAGWTRPGRFASAEETERRLLGAGFKNVRCWLDSNPVVPEEPEEYLETIVLGPHAQRLAPGKRRDFIQRVIAKLPKPVTIDYVRLNIDATKEDR